MDISSVFSACTKNHDLFPKVNLQSAKTILCILFIHNQSEIFNAVTTVSLSLLFLLSLLLL